MGEDEPELSVTPGGQFNLSVLNPGSGGGDVPLKAPPTPVNLLESIYLTGTPRSGSGSGFRERSLGEGGVTDKADPNLEANTVRRDSMGRRVKVLALDGTELLNLFQIKLAAVGVFLKLQRDVRQRRFANKLFAAGLFQTLAREAMLRRRAVCLCAAGMMFRGVAQRRLQAAGDVLVAVGLFPGLAKHAAAMEAASRRGKKGDAGKKKGGRSKYKQVNLNKDDVVDAELAAKSIYAQQKSTRGRRSSFMDLAASDLESDFAIKSKPFAYCRVLVVLAHVFIFSHTPLILFCARFLP